MGVSQPAIHKRKKRIIENIKISQKSNLFFLLGYQVIKKCPVIYEGSY